jgi:hypothetical protein
MQTNKPKTYAPKARRDFIAAVTCRAAIFGLTAERFAEAREKQKLAVGWVELPRNPAPSLQTREDIHAYLDKLRGALEKVIADGARTEIR